MRCNGACAMGLALWPFILCFALALPSQGPPTPARTSCIRMTPEKEQQIDLIVEKLGDFLHRLSIEHEHFDIRLIKLSIEQHSENEVEEKETVLQLSVNDCELSDDEVEEIDHHREKAKQNELEREKERKAKEQKETREKEKKAKEQEKLDKQKNNRVEKSGNETDNAKKDYDDDELQTNKNFEVMYLNLDETGEKLDEALGKKRPKLIYVQKDRGQIDYWYVKHLRR